MAHRYWSVWPSCSESHTPTIVGQCICRDMGALSVSLLSRLSSTCSPRRPPAQLALAGGVGVPARPVFPRRGAGAAAERALQRTGGSVGAAAWSAGAPARVGSGGQSRQQSAACHGSAGAASRWRATRLVRACQPAGVAWSSGGGGLAPRSVVTVRCQRSSRRTGQRGVAGLPPPLRGCQQRLLPPVGSATWGTLPHPSAPQGAQRNAAGRGQRRSSLHAGAGAPATTPAGERGPPPPRKVGGLFPARPSQPSRAAEPVKAKPCGWLEDSPALTEPAALPQ